MGNTNQKTNPSYSQHPVVFLLSVLLYRYLLDIVYAKVMSPVWGYAGFTYGPNYICSVLSWILLVLFAFIILKYLKSREEFISDIALVLFFLKIVPFTSFIRCHAQPLRFVALETISLLLIFVFLRIVPTPKLSNNYKSNALTNFIVFIMVVTVVFISGYYAQFRMNFNLLEVYDIRFEARDYDIPTILKYLRGASTNILPVALAYFLSKRKYTFSAIIAMAVFLSFSTNGMKSTLFKMIICIILFLLPRVDLKKYLGVAFAGLAGLAYLEWLLIDTDLISTVIIRRVLIMPQLLDSQYYDYIVNNGPLFYGNVNGYDGISFAIGDLYWNAPEVRANNGFFSDFYANLGAVGCFVYPLLYVYLFKICEAAFGEANNQIVMFSAIVIGYTLLGSFFTTALLTHGLFLLVVTMYVMPWYRRPKTGI